MNGQNFLPDIITLDDYKGIFADFFEAAYQIFKTDFVDSKPTFRGTRLGLKKHPLVDGKEYTFYHMTHEGKYEDNRVPDLRRLERIPYPRPMIDNSDVNVLKVWCNVRNGKNRILIFHEDENFLVILADRGSYILPWTTYYIQHSNRKRRLLEEYNTYINAETAQDS